MRLICAICSVSRQEAKRAGETTSPPPCLTRGSSSKSKFSPPWWDAIAAKLNLSQGYRFVRDSKNTMRRTQRIPVSNKRDSGGTLVCSSVIVKQCPKPGNDAPNGHQHLWNVGDVYSPPSVSLLKILCVPTRRTSFVCVFSLKFSLFGLLWKPHAEGYASRPAAPQPSL